MTFHYKAEADVGAHALEFFVRVRKYVRHTHLERLQSTHLCMELLPSLLKRVVHLQSTFLLAQNFVRTADSAERRGHSARRLFLVS